MTFNAAYSRARQDLVDLIPAQCARVLDLGCAAGGLGAALRGEARGDRGRGQRTGRRHGRRGPGQTGSGRRRRHRRPWGGRSAAAASALRCLVFGDVLEHLVDPWGPLEGSLELLSPDGFVVASIPNVRHIDTYARLLVRRRWPYRSRGIHDATHLRQFAALNVPSMFLDAGLAIVSLQRTYRLMSGHIHGI